MQPFEARQADPGSRSPEKSLVAGLRMKKNNLQRNTLHRQRRVEESAGTKAAIADELTKMSEGAASPAEFQRTAVRDVRQALENFEGDPEAQRGVAQKSCRTAVR